ncbi:hypothetical protein SALBM311S_12181 [Streptomyces alboniger]
MARSDEYYALHKQLRSRGRRVLIVGSSYLSPKASKNVIRVDAHLSDREISRVKQWLPSFGTDVPNSLSTSADSSFLALLYRSLPDTERGLRSGLSERDEGCREPAWRSCPGRSVSPVLPASEPVGAGLG